MDTLISRLFKNDLKMLYSASKSQRDSVAEPRVRSDPGYRPFCNLNPKGVAKEKLHL